MRTASWILLLIVAALTLLGGLVSAGIANSDRDFAIGGVAVQSVAAERPGLEAALRASRGTAAAYCAAFAMLVLFVVVGPYRRGDVWAWWALLAAFATYVPLVAVRLPTLGVRPGVAAAAIQGSIVLVALLLDLGRVTKR